MKRFIQMLQDLLAYSVMVTWEGRCYQHFAWTRAEAMDWMRQYPPRRTGDAVPRFRLQHCSPAGLLKETIVIVAWVDGVYYRRNASVPVRGNWTTKHISWWLGRV